MEGMIEGIQYLIDFFFVGIYDFVVEIFAYAIEWITLAKIELYIFMVKFSWDIAQQIMVNLQLSQYLEAAWGSLDSGIASWATFFRIPEAINIITQAAITKFTLRMIM